MLFSSACSLGTARTPTQSLLVSSAVWECASLGCTVLLGYLLQRGGQTLLGLGLLFSLGGRQGDIGFTPAMNELGHLLVPWCGARAGAPSGLLGGQSSFQAPRLKPSRIPAQQWQSGCGVSGHLSSQITAFHYPAPARGGWIPSEICFCLHMPLEPLSEATEAIMSGDAAGAPSILLPWLTARWERHPENLRKAPKGIGSCWALPFLDSRWQHCMCLHSQQQLLLALNPESLLAS